MNDYKRRLLRNGMLLFLVGLITGLIEQKFANIRMGVSAHLEGLMNGIFLLALGSAWTEVRLSARATSVAFWSALYGSYANWAITTFAAAFGTAALTPIAGAGHVGLPWQEALVTAGFTSVGIAMIGSSVLVLWGLTSRHESGMPV